MLTYGAMIYLDNSATTAVREEVREAMLPYLGEQGGNPSSVHKPGRAARKAVDRAREQVAQLLNCDPAEVFFSPCATYSNNVAIIGRARFAEANGHGKHLITSQIEHPSCLGPAKFLEANGWDVTFLSVNRDGLIDAKQFERALRKETSIVSLMWANNEIGSLFPIPELAALAKERGIYFHTDAVQVPGKLGIDVKALNVDTLSLSGHKFYAPKGIGVLFKKADVQVQPIVWGGGQESSLFPGTEAVANIVGIGKAAELAHRELSNIQPKLTAMQRILLDAFAGMEGVRITGPRAIEQRLPGHVSMVVSGVQGEAVVVQSDLKGLSVSAASACHKGIMQPSHVVTALGIDDELAMGSIRISAGRFNEEADCTRAVELISNIIKTLRAQEVKV
jgi:cysteine desulfurase